MWTRDNDKCEAAIVSRCNFETRVDGWVFVLRKTLSSEDVSRLCRYRQNCASLAFQPTAQCTSVIRADALPSLLIFASCALFCGFCRSRGGARRASGEIGDAHSTAGSGLVGWKSAAASLLQFLATSSQSAHILDYPERPYP